MGNAHAQKTERRQNCGEDARKLSLRNMWVATVEDYRPTPPVTRFREGAVVRPPGLCSRAMREMKRSATWLREQAAQAIDKTLGVSNGELLLESMLWPSEVAQEAHNLASTFKTTGDVAGALRHAPAYSITSTPVTTLAHMPATHNTLYEDTYGKAGQQYESSEEDSGISDCSDDSASDGRVSPETSGELPTKRLPGRLPTRGPSVERPAGKKQLKRKAKPKISPADTGGRDADPMSADTPADLPAPFSLSTTSADTLLAVQAAPGDTPTSLEGMPGTPEEVTATAAHADDMAGFPDGKIGRASCRERV